MDLLREARQKLEEEAQRIDYELRFTLPREIHRALGQGDLSENAEYEAAKERQSTLHARLTQIRKRLADLSTAYLAESYERALRVADTLRVAETRGELVRKPLDQGPRR
mgnify:CR=1 FL=1